MGLARWVAKKLKSEDTSEGPEVKSKSKIKTNKQESPYRSIYTGIPDNATKEDLDAIMRKFVRTGLITQAQSLKYFKKLKTGKPVAERDREDYVFALKQLIENGELPPEVFHDQIERARVVINKRIMILLEKQIQNFIEELNIPEENKDKLREMITFESYERACQTVKILDPECRLPSRDQIITELLKLSPLQMKKIAVIMEKPALIIEPDKSFEQLKKQHKRIQGFVAKEYEWADKSPGKVKVCIMDVVQYPKVIPGQEPSEQRADEQLRICEKYFRDNGMSLVDERQYVIAMVQTFPAYAGGPAINEDFSFKENALDYGDSNRNTPSTFTAFNQERRSSISMINLGSYRRDHQGFELENITPEEHYLGMRGRGVVEIMEL